MNQKVKEWIKHNGLVAILLLGLLIVIIYQQPQPIIKECECPDGQELVCQDTYDLNFTYNIEELYDGNKDFNTDTERSGNWR